MVINFYYTLMLFYGTPPVLSKVLRRYYETHIHVRLYHGFNTICLSALTHVGQLVYNKGSTQHKIVLYNGMH